MNHAQMNLRCPTAKFIGPYYLKGWKLAFGNHATIVPCKGHRVPGALWQLTMEDLVALDRYEGWPAYYTRRRWNQDDINFFFYEMTSRSGSPSDWYLQGIEQGYIDCGVDPAYLHKIVRSEGLTYNANKNIIIS